MKPIYEYLYKIYVFHSLTTVPREKWTRSVEKFENHPQQNLQILKHVWFSDDGYFHLMGTLTGIMYISGALSNYKKFINPLCMPRKSWCGVWFPHRV